MFFVGVDWVSTLYGVILIRTDPIKVRHANAHSEIWDIDVIYVISEKAIRNILYLLVIDT